jgi:mono/diheme cytochrome c family protein
MRALNFAFSVIIATVLSFPQSLMAEEGSSATPTAADIATGKQDFMQYCAQCHGADATGDGPVAADLKRKPANLTILTKKHRGIFPRRAVRDFIIGIKKMPSHGTREMPVWGYAFMFRQGGMAGPFVPIATPDEVNARIDRLVDYIRSIQQK